MMNLKTLALVLLPFFCQAQTPIEKVGNFKFDMKGNAQTTAYWDKSKKLIFFKADYDLDLDGSPFAYNPQNTGLLHNGNATDASGKMSRSVVAYQGNEPYIQSATDPAPGYYLSMTSLQIKGFGQTDHRRYVHPDSVRYFVLPGNKFSKYGVSLGDVGLVYNTRNKKYAFAIFADGGPSAIVGEGSSLLAKALDIPCRVSPKTKRIVGGMDTGDVLYIVLPGSGKGVGNYTSVTNTEVDKLGKAATKSFGTQQALIDYVMAQLN